MPSPAASIAAWRRAPRSAGSRFATPAISSAKTVVPQGTAPPASPSAPRCPHRLGVVLVDMGLDGLLEGGAPLRTTADDVVEEEDDSHWKPRAPPIPAKTTSR